MEKDKEKIPKYLDKTVPLKERRLEFKKITKEMMNPFPVEEFNPDTFEPMGEDMAEVADRARTLPQKKLPTFNLKPKPVREGQMIGMYESKQDIYLTFAHRCNQLQEEIDLLKSKIK